jgi:hypothetical protein
VDEQARALCSALGHESQSSGRAKRNANSRNARRTALRMTQLSIYTSTNVMEPVRRAAARCALRAVCWARSGPPLAAPHLWAALGLAGSSAHYPAPYLPLERTCNFGSSPEPCTHQHINRAAALGCRCHRYRVHTSRLNSSQALAPPVIRHGARTIAREAVATANLAPPQTRLHCELPFQSLLYKVTARATVLYLPIQRSFRKRAVAHSQNGLHCRVRRIKVDATTDSGQITFRTAMTTGGTLWFGPRPVPATPKSIFVPGKTLTKLAQNCAQKVYRPCVRLLTV